MTELDLDAHLAQAATDITAAKDLAALKDLDGALLGKKSAITAAKRTLGGLEPDQRRALGLRIIVVRDELTGLL